MRGLPLTLILIMSASASATTVYKWVDDNGVTHFSDQPNPKAQKLEISGAQTYAAQAATPAPTTEPSAGAGAPMVCAIDSPAAGQVFLDTYSISGHVTVSHAEGAQATLRMDGRDISGLLATDGSFALSQVDRGDHILTLQVMDSRGNVACSGAAVTFSIRQRSAVGSGTATAPTAPGAPTAPRAPGVGQPH